MDVLLQYEWPGNVRELENAIERAMVIGSPPMLTPNDLPFKLSDTVGAVRSGTLADVERIYIQDVLHKNDWNISRSAEELDIDRVTLYHKIEKYGFKKPA